MRSRSFPSARARARLLALTLAMAVLAEPSLAVLRGSTLGPCPCGHGSEEAVAEPETNEMPPCHAHMESEPEPERAEASTEAARPGEDCIEAYCPHCSADQPRLLVSDCGLTGEPSPRSTLPAHGPIPAEDARESLPDVVLEILHVPIP